MSIPLPLRRPRLGTIATCTALWLRTGPLAATLLPFTAAARPLALIARGLLAAALALTLTLAALFVAALTRLGLTAAAAGSRAVLLPRLRFALLLPVAFFALRRLLAARLVLAVPVFLLLPTVLGRRFVHCVTGPVLACVGGRLPIRHLRPFAPSRSVGTARILLRLPGAPLVPAVHLFFAVSGSGSAGFLRTAFSLLCLALIIGGAIPGLRARRLLRRRPRRR